MDGLRHLYDVKLWDATAVSWPSMGNGAHICLANDDGVDTLVNDPTYIGYNSATGITNILWFDNADNADFVRINFNGTVAGVTATGAAGGDSITRGGLVGLPLIGQRTYEDNPLLQQHPLETTRMAVALADGWIADGISGISQSANSFPPYWGQFFGTAFQVNVVTNGWPFSSGITPTVNDGWSIQFPLTRQHDGSELSISGIRRIGLIFKSVNPSLTNISAFSITGQMWAHFYEYRKRR